MGAGGAVSLQPVPGPLAVDVGEAVLAETRDVLKRPVASVAEPCVCNLCSFCRKDLPGFDAYMKGEISWQAVLNQCPSCDWKLMMETARAHWDRG